jgi:hypothetical protein
MNEVTDTTSELARLRLELLVGITRHGSRRRHRRRVATLATALILLGGTTAAATTGFFHAAPGWVKGIFGGVDNVDSSSAVKLSVIDDHIMYAAPSADGGFCLYFRPNERSGPNGLGCVGSEGQSDIPISLEFGHDGSFVIGRVIAANANEVELVLPGDDSPLSTPVRDDGFFLIRLPITALKVLMADDITVTSRSIKATARDGAGTTVAKSAAPPALSQR